MPSCRDWLIVERPLAPTALPHMLLMVLTLAAGSNGSKCFQRLDIAIAVDVASSANDADFLQVTSVLKKIPSDFLIGQTKTRLALMSFSQRAEVVANFHEVNSLSDFNAAVDRLKRSSGPPSVFSALQEARSSVLNLARKSGSSSTLMILVRDGRSEDPGADIANLARIKAEAAAVKAMKVAIHAVAIGGLWNMKELEALFGSNYIMFLNQSRAMEYVKSLNNNRICIDCQKKSEKPGLCLDKWRHVVKLIKFEAVDSSGDDICRTEIQRQVESCHERETCYKLDRTIGACATDGKLNISDSWQYFSGQQGSCVTHKLATRASCDNSTKCSSQTADVVILLDKSYSTRKNFSTVKEVAKALVQSFEVGPSQVRVGLLVFHSRVSQLAALHPGLSKPELLSNIDGVSTLSDFGTTMTQMALDDAKDMFRSNARPGAEKFLVLITSGKSRMPERTFQSTAFLKELGVTVLAVGVGEVNENELTTLTAPESGTNLLLLKDFNELNSWTDRISARLCLQMASPNPILCSEGVTLHSISVCTHRMQQVTHVEYKFDSVAKTCIKHMQTTMGGRCKAVCTDPIDGRQYAEGETWTNLCQQLACDSVNLLQILPANKCLAADNTCKSVNSAPFKCKDDENKEFDGCQCVLKNGIAVLTIDRKV